MNAPTNPQRVSLRTGAQRFELLRSDVLDAFFGTVAYRLEPIGEGTRFPMMQQLRLGGLEPDRLEQALAELAELAKALEQLPKEQVVRGLLDLRRVDDRDRAFNRTAPNAYRFLSVGDARPLVDCLREAALLARSTGERLVLESRERSQFKRIGSFGLVFGSAWVVLGYFLAPGMVFVRDWPPLVTADQGSEGIHGLLLWPMGFLVVAQGIGVSLGAKFPALRLVYRKYERSATVAILLGVLATLVISWR
jgi:hypothetical protein